jgi:hypothetical protein
MSLRIHWGFGIAFVYTAFALGTTGVAIFAMHERVDLVSADYYARSMNHDGHLAAVARARALEEAGALDVRISPDGRTVDLRWTDSDRGPLDGTITLYRAADAAADRVLPMLRDPSGHQRVSFPGLANGRWTLKLEWQEDAREYYTERELIVR